MLSHHHRPSEPTSRQECPRHNRSLTRSLSKTLTSQEEMDEILTRQELPYKSVKRIISRQYGTPTKLFRLILKDEGTRKKLIRDGINLDQMHYKCEAAREDSKSHPKIMQCYKCQQLGDHLAAACPNEQKCVQCSGPHRKSKCTVSKEEFKSIIDLTLCF